MKRTKLRVVLSVALLGVAGIAASLADAAEYPARPIRYVVAFAPGGINDILARIVGQKLNETWGQPVIVDNRPGAGGNLAAELVSKATADGYTFMNISTAHTISQTLYAKLNYSLEMGNWTGIVAPAKTPKNVVNQLAAEITRIIRSPEMSKRLLEMGVDPMGGTPEEFGKLIRSEIARFGKAVKASGAKAD